MNVFSPWHLIVLLLLVAGFGVLVAVVLVALIRAAGARSRQGSVPGLPPVGERLAELDDLLQRGSISPQEHGEARARVLGDV